MAMEHKLILYHCHKHIWIDLPKWTRIRQILQRIQNWDDFFVINNSDHIALEYFSCRLWNCHQQMGVNDFDTFNISIHDYLQRKLLWWRSLLTKHISFSMHHLIMAYTVHINSFTSYFSFIFHKPEQKFSSSSISSFWCKTANFRVKKKPWKRWGIKITSEVNCAQKNNISLE